MAPHADDSQAYGNSEAPDVPQSQKPLKLGTSLSKFDHDDSTPVIGREFPTVNIVDDLMNAANADELLRDLAVTISQRGVVFFRAQNNLTNDLQKVLVQKLGELSGKPAASTLHIHPIINDMREFGAETTDNEISTISSTHRKRLFDHDKQLNKLRYDSARWHSDIQFENYPADYTSLRLTQLPKTGGDTLFASGYELYDRFSRPYQKFLEGLTATYIGEGFIKASQNKEFKLYDKPRGHPANIGPSLTAIHPVVRTNPVTGWKSVYPVGAFPKYINEVNREESDDLLKKFYSMVLENHDLQVRFKWKSQNDIAIWDNRSVFHCATFDYDSQGERHGNRAVGIGERPYFDPSSTSRTEALAKEI